MQKRSLSMAICFLILSPLSVQAIGLSQVEGHPNDPAVLPSTIGTKPILDVVIPDEKPLPPKPLPPVEVPPIEKPHLDPQPTPPEPPPVVLPQPTPPPEEVIPPPVPSPRVCSPENTKMLENLRGETAKGASFEEINGKFGSSIDLDCTPSESETEQVSLLKSQQSLAPWPWWSTWYEQLESCGYHPQRREFACALRLKRNFGYGGFPPVPNLGSFEWVTICAQVGNTMKLVNIGQVHVHDAPQGSPPWHYGITIPDNPWLHTYPNTNGQPLKAQATLSWYTPVLSCNSQPVWGNIIGFQIKLDP